MQVFKTRSTLFGLGKYLQRLMIQMDDYLKGNIFFQKTNYMLHLKFSICLGAHILIRASTTI